MLIAQYFVEFIFYSFLGWVWESIYCTAQNKEWQDRGFLFGPICPIYGSCVVAVNILFGQISALSSPDFPIWGIFLICMIGSAIAEFATSWVLEKRFHAMWWDYSHLPLNIQGRICLPVSVGFGLAGIVVVKYLIPFVSDFHSTFHPLVYEGLALGFAILFGADFALTEASLSSLLSDIENYKNEWNRRAEETYTSITTAPKRLEENLSAAKENVAENIANARGSVAENIANARDSVAENMVSAMETAAGGPERLKQLADSYAERMSANQIRIFNNIERFKPKEGEEKQVSGLPITTHLKRSLSLKRHSRKKK